MINLNGITLSFGERDLFKNISLRLDGQARIGLVGRNGAGKSTLLKIITGLAKADSGSISIPNGFKLGYMAQDVVLQSDKSIFQEALSADEDYWKLKSRIDEIEQLLEADSHNASLVQEYSDLQFAFQGFDSHSYERDVKEILVGLGFGQDSWDNPVDSLSVGWKMRLVLAKLLLKKADFYLFDEPTNHLDIIAREWFLRFLKQAPFGFILISHDKHFLNTLCSSIIELEAGDATVYNGNYDQYEIAKEANLESLIARYNQQQREIKHKQDLINKFRAKASKAKFAQSLIRELDKMERIELPPMIKNISISMASVQRSGKLVLNLNNVQFAYNDKPVFKDVSLSLERGKRVAIIAPNGGGKTTLLNCITGKLKSQGHIDFGHNVEWALFDQDQTKALDLQRSIFDNIYDSVSDVTEQQIRTMLGSFLFPQDDVYKKVKVLSGGEKNRVGIVKTLLTQSNFLMLDEPTNHLDIISKDILKKALQAFEGTILFVSHDHDFIADVADTILELTPQGAHLFPGTYEEFLFYKNESESNGQTTISKQHQKEVQRSISKGQSKESRLLEREISKLEAQIEKTQNKFADLEYGTPEFQAQCDKLKQLEVDLEAAMERWQGLLLED
jgi:ATP-binding cassette, subfamily F, member 3